MISCKDKKDVLSHLDRYSGKFSSSRGLPMQVFSGKAFYPQDPQVQDIDIVDIAHHLSMLVRFNGAVKSFLSVAQHSVALSYLVSKENAFSALMHDAPEAYIGDLIRPIKYLFPEFSEIENKIWLKIAEKYGLDENLPDEVKFHDTKICFTEKRDFLNESINIDWGIECKPHEEKMFSLSPQDAKLAFLNRFEELYNG